MLAAVVGGLCLLAGEAGTHEALNRFVHHRLHLTAHEKYIDLRVELTFYAENALAERLRMDTSGDGTIREDEVRRYIRNILQQFDESSATENLQLQLDDAELRLIERYAPDVELWDETEVKPAPCVIRFEFFAAMPRGLESGSRLQVKDNLWPERPAHCTLSVEAYDGYGLVTRTAKEPSVPNAETEAATDGLDLPGRDPSRILWALCTEAPPPTELITRKQNAWRLSRFSFLFFATLFPITVAGGCGVVYAITRLRHSKGD